MAVLSGALSSLGISLGVHAPERLDRVPLHAALVEARSRDPEIVISMLPLPFEPGIVGDALFPASQPNKFTQFLRFQQSSIPTLLTKLFKFGATFPGSPLDIVTLKPSILDTSLPHAMITLRNGVLHKLIPGDFEPEHPIRQHPYVVQEYLETDRRPTSFRVVLFLGRPLLSYKMISRVEHPQLASNGAHVGPEFISNNGHDGFDAQLESNDEMLEVAVGMSLSVGHPPLAKCDLLYNTNKGWRALEVSVTDFNGWPLGRQNLVDALGREAMINQFDMINTIAKRICELAEGPLGGASSQVTTLDPDKEW